MKRQLLEVGKKNTPDFQIEIPGVLSLYKHEEDHTVLFISMTITNAGLDSAVRGYKVNYQSATLQRESPILLLMDEVVEIDMPGGQSFRMRGIDAINRRTDTPIVRGSYIAGRLPVLVPGDRTSEIHSGLASVTVTIRDFLGKEYSATFKGDGPQGGHKYIIGEPIVPKKSG